jgi:hypothetical protein
MSCLKYCNFSITRSWSRSLAAHLTSAEPRAKRRERLAPTGGDQVVMTADDWRMARAPSKRSGPVCIR